MTTQYVSNNSGGGWWLTDADWAALEAAGWHVEWLTGEETWLEARAISATRYGVSMAEAIEEWESITGQQASASGCECCGQPHNFYAADDVDAAGR